MHGRAEDSGAQRGHEGEYTTRQHHHYKSWKNQLRTDHGSDCGEEFDVACAHRSEDVQDKHQNESQHAATNAVKSSVQSAQGEVDRQPAYQSGKYEWIRNAAIPHVVIDDQDGER